MIGLDCGTMKSLITLAVLLGIWGCGYVLLGAQQRTQPGTYVRFGLGLESCGRWVTERARESRVASEMDTWVAGYVTGYAAAEISPGRTMLLTDVAALNVWVDNYCRLHPLEKVADAALKLATELLTP